MWSVLLIFLVYCVLFFALFVFVLCLVFPVLPVSLDSPFLIAPSLFLKLFIFKIRILFVPETLATLGTQDTGQKQTKQKTKHSKLKR
jgi:hypothetical protein